MSSETTVCPGCDNTFTLRGYQSHLAQSNDPLCSAVFDQLKKASETYQRLEKDANSSNEASHEAEAPAFQGDTFGSAEDNANDSEQSDDEDFGEEMVAELERSWEPPREGAPDQLEEIDTAIDNEDNPDSTSDDEDMNNQYNRDRYIIGDGYRVKPAVRIRYRDKHTSSHAGEVLSQEESMDSGYAAALNGGDNPWSPFNSEKDWEIAKWAKLHGVGSTAFSDLLAIDRVIFMHFVIINAILTYVIDLRRP